MRTRLAASTAVVIAGGLTLAACGSSSGSDGSGGGQPVSLALVAYSTPQPAYEKIIAAFQKTAAGKNVTFTQSYGPSGDQSRAVDAGQKADVVAFSLAPDIQRLVDDGKVASTWNSNAHKGFVTDSVVVITTRKGDPKHLTTWASLTKPGVQVITPNPFTSGGAKWNIMAAYGANSAKGTQNAAGVSYLHKLFHNVVVQDDSGAKSLATFTNGKGDAALTYENEAIYAKAQGAAIDYTVPSSTILIQNPVAVLKSSKHLKQAKAFVNFLYSKTAQKIYADTGYRPVVSGIQTTSTFPTPSQLFTIDDLGGWDKVNTDFFDPDSSVMATVEKQLGVSTSK